MKNNKLAFDHPVNTWPNAEGFHIFYINAEGIVSKFVNRVQSYGSLNCRKFKRDTD